MGSLRYEFLIRTGILALDEQLPTYTEINIFLAFVWLATIRFTILLFHGPRGVLVRCIAVTVLYEYTSN